MTDSNKSHDQIREYHRMGQLVLMPGTMKSNADEKLYRKFRELNEDSQRRIRQFADPVLGYTTVELDELLSQCVKHDYNLGFSVLTRLLAIPKESRQEAQALTVKLKWGRRDLNHHIKATFGTRQPAGRRPKRFNNPQMLKAAIQSTCLSWCRQATSMKKENASVFEQLPSVFKDYYQQITRLNEKLANFDSATDLENTQALAKPKKRQTIILNRRNEETNEVED